MLTGLFRYAHRRWDTGVTVSSIQTTIDAHGSGYLVSATYKLSSDAGSSHTSPLAFDVRSFPFSRTEVRCDRSNPEVWTGNPQAAMVVLRPKAGENWSGADILFRLYWATDESLGARCLSVPEILPMIVGGYSAPSRIPVLTCSLAGRESPSGGILDDGCSQSTSGASWLQYTQLSSPGVAISSGRDFPNRITFATELVSQIPDRDLYHVADRIGALADFCGTVLGVQPRGSVVVVPESYVSGTRKEAPGSVIVTSFEELGFRD
jgi:hypothetical protein